MASATGAGSAQSTSPSHSRLSSRSTAARSVARSMSATPPFASALEVSECESAIGFLDELAYPRLGLHQRSGRRSQALDSFLEQAKRVVERHLGSLELANDRLDARDV